MARVARSFLSIWAIWAIWVSGLSLVLGAPASAVPVTVTHTNLPTCDVLAVPFSVDELGDASGFPPDERIMAVDLPATSSACATTNLALPDVLVSMTNLTQTDFTEVWYVADPETSITNVDGLVNGEEAFRIDAAGVNRPLVFESLAANGIFEAGETWDFIIDDYINSLGLGADAFFSPGAVGGASPGGPSSGSIIAVPEPTSLALLGIGLLGLALRRLTPTAV